MNHIDLRKFETKHITTKPKSACHDVDAQTNYELFALGYLSHWHWVCPECLKMCDVYHVDEYGLKEAPLADQLEDLRVALNELFTEMVKATRIDVLCDWLNRQLERFSRR